MFDFQPHQADGRLARGIDFDPAINDVGLDGQPIVNLVIVHIDMLEPWEAGRRYLDVHYRSGFCITVNVPILDGPDLRPIRPGGQGGGAAIELDADQRTVVRIVRDFFEELRRGAGFDRVGFVELQLFLRDARGRGQSEGEPYGGDEFHLGIRINI